MKVLILFLGTMWLIGTLSLLMYSQGEKKMAAASTRIIGHICDEVKWETPACQTVRQKAGEVSKARNF